MERHSRYVDALEELLRQSASLKDLWWFREGLEQLYVNSLKRQPAGKAPAEDELQLAKSRGQFVCYSLGLFSHAMHNGHPLAGPEHEALGNAAVGVARKWIDLLMQSTSTYLKELTTEWLYLADQAQPVECFQRYTRAKRKKSKKKKKASSSTADGAAESKGDDDGDEEGDELFAGALKPGEESRPQHRTDRHVANVLESSQCLGGIMAALSRQPTVRVFDSEFNVLESVRRCVVEELRSAIRLAAQSSKGGALTRPSDMAIRLTAVQDAVMRATEGGMFFGRLIQQIFEEENSSGNLTAPGTVVHPAKTTPTSERFAEKMAQWFTRFINVGLKAPTATGVVYAPRLHGYQNDKRASSRMFSLGGLQAELFANSVELQHLAGSLGVTGVRVVEAELLAQVAMHAVTLKSFMTANRDALGSFHDHVDRPSEWVPAVKSLTSLDKLGVCLMNIGHTVILRQLLRDSLGRCVEHALPSTAAVAEVAARQSRSSGDVWKATRLFAADLGVESSRDESLLSALAPVVSTVDAAKMWMLAPEALACAFLSPVWKGQKYLFDLHAFANNAHAMVPAMHQLLVALHGLCIGKLGSEHGRHESLNTIEGWERRFLKCASFNVLNAQQKGTPVKNVPWEQVLSLERFTVISPFVCRSDMEKWLPYPLVHAVVVDSSSGGKGKVDQFVAAANSSAGALGDKSVSNAQASGRFAAVGSAGAGAGAGAGAS